MFAEGIVFTFAFLEQPLGRFSVKYCPKVSCEIWKTFLEFMREAQLAFKMDFIRSVTLWLTRLAISDLDIQLGFQSICLLYTRGDITSFETCSWLFLNL